MLSKRGRGGKGSWQVSRVVARAEASKVSTKEGIWDSIKPNEGENNMKLSIKKVGTGTQRGRSE